MIALITVQLIILVVMLVQINSIDEKVDYIYGLVTGESDENNNNDVPEPSEPTIVDVSVDDDPWIGGENADVVIVEFSDFECPFCARGAETIHELIEEYGDDIKVVYRDFPLGFHQYAHISAQAAECAAEQDKFWEYHDLLFENQNALDSDSLKGYAEELGLDTDQFNECLDSGEMSAEVDADLAEGSSYGVQGTPAFFVNGELISGAQPIENFRPVIDKYL